MKPPPITPKRAVTLFSWVFPLAVLLAFSSALATEEDQKERGYTNDWLIFYYQNPKPDEFAVQVKAMSKSGYLGDEKANSSIVAFLSRIIAQNPTKVRGWIDQLKDLPKKDQDALYLAMWFSQLEEARQIFKEKGLDAYRSKRAPDILGMEIDSAEVLDMLWGYFLATGDSQPVRRIVSAFNYSKYVGSLEAYKTSKKTKEDKKKAYYEAIFQAAIWSVGSNCKQHERVKKICTELLTGTELNKTEKNWLEVILARNDMPDVDFEVNEGAWRKDGKPVSDTENMKSKDGFGAQLFLTEDSKLLDDWNKLEAPHIKTAEKARRGVPLFAVILFVNPGKDASGAADIKYDIVMKRPDGSVYGEQKDVVGWKGDYKALPRTLQLGLGSMGIEIEPKDPSGTYVVEVTVRDGVRKVEFSLKKSFSVDK